MKFDPTARGANRRQRRETQRPRAPRISGRRRVRAVEQLEVRNLLTTYENSFTWTTFEDQTGDGITSDDIPFRGAVIKITEHVDSIIGARPDQTFVGSGSYSSSLFWGEIHPDFGCGRCDSERFTVEWEPLPGWVFSDLDQKGDPCTGHGVFGPNCVACIQPRNPATIRYKLPKQFLRVQTWDDQRRSFCGPQREWHARSGGY